jgi:hypothetical protein
MTTRFNITVVCVLLAAILSGCLQHPEDLTPHLEVSGNGRYLSTENGDPFFWLGDTGWLLLLKLSREEAARYFDVRIEKGFNVIQVSLVHNVDNCVNFYGDTALVNHNLDQPLLTNGESPGDPEQYDYWDHVDYIVSLAHRKGLYLAMVPVWGSNVRSGRVTIDQAQKYAEWLADRYGNEPNIIWVNGGDVKGSDSTRIWNTIGTTLHKNCPGQLITFHPFGRSQSSEWFHDASWLAFNMFQSGHRRYDQDTSDLCYGEDNWRYMEADYKRTPVKPSLDGEPSYESIPQGLHDPSQPYWTDADVRRYAYWSVFAGACGFTYGHNAVMQFNKKNNPEPAYGVREYWEDALKAPGASEMTFLKKLMLSRPYFERIPSQEIIAGEAGQKYDYIAVTRGDDFAFAYTFTGKPITIDTDKLGWKKFTSSWYNPRNGTMRDIGKFRAGGAILFDPPGDPSPGNDWVLILDKEQSERFAV